MPDQVRHDDQKSSTFLNYDTVSEAGVQELQCFLDSRLRGNDKTSKFAFQSIATQSATLE
jgi:hypothetical protein